jgi:hypothetical protein
VIFRFFLNYPFKRLTVLREIFYKEDYVLEFSSIFLVFIFVIFSKIEGVVEGILQALKKL